jgi:group I intron endonuclease
VNTGVYEIVNLVNGKRYVGSAANFKTRWSVHRHGLKRGKHHSPHLQAAWNKYGAQAFEFRRLLICDPPNLVVYEQAAFDALAPEYNVCRKARSTLGIRWSDEAKARIAATRPNDHFKGRKHSAETKARMSAAQIGNTATLGRKRGPDEVAAIAAAHRGMKRSDEARERMSAAMRLSWAKRKSEI